MGYPKGIPPLPPLGGGGGEQSSCQPHVGTVYAVGAVVQQRFYLFNFHSNRVVHYLTELLCLRNARVVVNHVVGNAEFGTLFQFLLQDLNVFLQRHDDEADLLGSEIVVSNHVVDVVVVGLLSKQYFFSDSIS